MVTNHCCHSYRHHATHKFLDKLKKEEGIEDIISEAVDGGEIEERKRKCDRCISCFRMTCAIICGRHYVNELNKLKEKEERQNQRKENDIENGNNYHFLNESLLCAL